MPYEERQITFDSRNHQLTNINVWTPDSQYLVYDVRPNGASFTGLTIEKIHITSLETTVIYQATQGAYVGVATVSPDQPVRYAFIHGPENPDSSWYYDFHHRRGVYVNDGEWNISHNIEALSLTPPYVAGALRGGTHVHVFSPDGKWLSFTYNDHVMHELDIDLDQRNIAVAVPIGPVHINNRTHHREYDGNYFCCQITETCIEPVLGSNDISRAYEEGWVGKKGYRNNEGQWQSRAIVFLGDTHAQTGEIVPEIFIVDLPDDPQDMMLQGQYPLEGTEQRLPYPPRNIKQRRLTFSHHLPYPGIVNQPRHWLRTSPDGSQIACLRKDQQGIVQLWLASTAEGELRQITFGATGIQSAFTWDNQGQYIALIYDYSLVLCDIFTGKMSTLTARSNITLCTDAVVFSPDNTKVAFMRDIDGFRQLFIVETGLLSN